MSHEALTLPGVDTPVWTVRKRNDPAGAGLANRHYSRRTKGAAMFSPPGKALVLVTPCERAVWVTSYTEYPDDGLDAWRCTLFRNEGAGLSSTLILAAMAETQERWGAAPPSGWITWVDPRKVRSTNPGFCFIVAGWQRSTWAHRHLIRLHARARHLRLAA